MKVLLINGSPRKNGCTYTALSVVSDTLQEHGVETEIFQVGTAPVRDCVACRMCAKNGNSRCVFDDDVVNRLIEKAEECDGFIFGSPVYYAHPSGFVLSLLDRAFFAGAAAFRHKPGAAVVSARRAGTTASLDVLNKYFTISQMPVVSSSYWNMVHGSKAEDVLQDAEGINVMRNLGHNMAWMLQCIEAGKANGILPPQNITNIRTDFIR